MLALPVVLALYELNAEPLALADGSYDDASQRGAGLFLLIVLPIAYCFIAFFYAGAAHILVRLGRFTRESFMWVAAIAPWSLVILGTVGLIANNHSWLLGFLMLLVIGMLMSILAVGGAATWLFLALPKTSANSAFRRTAAGGH